MLAACSDDSGGSSPDAGGIPDGGKDDMMAPDSAAPDAGKAACGAIPTFADGKSPTALIHVAPGGSDTSGDGSAAKPFATLSRAAKSAKPGAAIRLAAGTHTGGNHLRDLAGTATAPVWIGGTPGNATRPVISGGNTGLQLSRSSYLVLHDLEVKGARDNGVNMDDGGAYSDPTAAHHIVVRNLYVHDIGSGGNQDCLKLSGLRDYVVMDSTFEKCGGGGSGSGVDHVGCHRGVIARNTFRNLSANAVQCKGGSADLEIRWNLMIDAGQRAVNMGGSTGLTFFRPPASKTGDNAEARRIRVIANVIKGGNTPFAFVGCVDCLAAHNTVIDPERWLMRILQETKTGSGYTFLPASRGKVQNNIFYFSRAKLSTYLNIGANTSPKTFTFNNNLWYAHDKSSQSIPSLPVAETAGVTGKDPGFSGATSGDYAIGAASPAAGKGAKVKGVAGDRAGRCYKDPPSIGAYEVTP